MEYQALYRKYRPGRFDDVIGQDHVTHTLAREIVEGRVAHAYLFSGPRGTGKTTTARILAKSLNCPHREAQGEPCGTCDSCAAVTGSHSMDVMELDAASHNKVEDVRDLRASVSTVATVGGAKRVFILDEAHMLTKSASNALLKTLEEPPDHVHFVLATTEPYRLLDTIRSRSQRFDFQLVRTDLIAGHLGRISEAEGYRASPEALMEVARRATGSVRDALSLLEQVAALDGSVTRKGIRDALGVAGPDAMPTLVRAILDSDAKPALELIAALAASGVDLRRFTGDAMGFFRGVFLTMYTPNLQSITDEPAEVLEGWKEASRRLPRATVMRAIDLLGEALVRLREGREERMMLEMAVLKLVRPELDTDSGALLNRIERLERRLSSVQPREPEPARLPAAGPPSPRVVPSEEQPKPRPVPAPPPDREAAAEQPAAAGPPRAGDPGDVVGAGSVREASGAGIEQLPTPADLDRIWPQLVAGVRDEMGQVRGALFRDAIPRGVENSTLVFTIPAGLDFHLQRLSSDHQLHRYLAGLAERLLGRRVEVSFRAAESPTPDPATGGEWPMEPLPDKESLAEAPPANTDALSLLKEQLGARVVKED